MDTYKNLLFLLMPFIGAFCLYILSSTYFSRLGQFPLNSFSSRRPAQSKLVAIRQQIPIYFVLLFFIPLMLGLGVYILSVEGFSTLSTMVKVMVLIYAILLLVALIFFLRCIGKINKYNLHVNAEQGVGHLLLATEKKGFTVHHDVVLGKKMVVPHVVVGPAGVFVVNILVQSRPFFSKQGSDIRVKYFNSRFNFPNAQNKKVVKQSEEMAAAIQIRVNKHAGTNVPLKSMLTIPGWYLEKKEKAPIIVLPTQQLAAFISTFADKNLLDDFTLEKINDCISGLSPDSR